MHSRPPRMATPAATRATAWARGTPVRPEAPRARTTPTRSRTPATVIPALLASADPDQRLARVGRTGADCGQHDRDRGQPRDQPSGRRRPGRPPAPAIGVERATQVGDQREAPKARGERGQGRGQPAQGDGARAGARIRSGRRRWPRRTTRRPARWRRAGRPRSAPPARPAGSSGPASRRTPRRRRRRRLRPAEGRPRSRAARPARRTAARRQPGRTGRRSARPGPPRRLARNSVITTATCWASRVTTPAAASRRARVATPGGKLSDARSLTPERSTGQNSGRLSAATPIVVPTDRTSSALTGRRARSSRPAPRAPRRRSSRRSR